MSKSEKAPGGVTPEQSGKKLPGFVKKVGALALALLAAGGIWHKAHEPAMSDEQMHEATNIAATTALDKVNEIKNQNPDLNDDDDSSFIGEGSDIVSFYAYGGDPDGDTEKGSGTNVEISITDGGSSDKDGIKTSTSFVFSTKDKSALDEIKADNKVTLSEVEEFTRRSDVNVSKIESHEDSNGDRELTPETLELNAYNGGDDHWRLKVNKQDGVHGFEESHERIGNGFVGNGAVAEVQKAVDTVTSNWGDNKSKN